MNFKKLFAVVAVMFASFIQVGCGTSQQGNCGTGQLYQNGVCTNSAYQTGYNNYGTNTTAACTSGATYPGNSMGCAQGYTLQGSQCVCSTSITNPTTGSNNGCQAGTYPFQNSCYPQGPCVTGYVFYLPTGMCYRVQ